MPILKLVVNSCINTSTDLLTNMTCTGPSKYRGFSAVYVVDSDFALPTGILRDLWVSSVGPEEEHYGSFNDGNFSNDTGTYTVPSDGRYTIDFCFSLYIADKDITTDGDVSSITATVTSSDSGEERPVLKSKATELQSQSIALSAGDVVGNTVNATTQISGQRTVYLNAGDKVKLLSIMYQPWYVSGDLNTFSIARLL